MDCDRVTELLPWLLNGAMDDPEQRQVKDHIVTCPRCRQELADIVLAWNIYQSHVPADVLVDYAFQRPVSDPQPEAIERHLATCNECAEQFGMARESYRWSESEEPESVPGPEPAATQKVKWWEMWRWQYAALAASLAAMIAGGGWLWTWQRARTWQAGSVEEQQVARERLAGLEAENQRLRQVETQLRQQGDEVNRQIAQLQKQNEELSAPQLNVLALDVYPIASSERLGKADDKTVRIPADAKIVTLFLNSQSRAGYRSYRLEIVDESGRQVWSNGGLARQAGTNSYTINLRADSLAPGRYTINVYAETGERRAPVDSYRIRIAQPRR